MSQKYLNYKTEEITVMYNPKLCIHAAECVKGLPKVFNPMKKPWVEPGNATVEETINVVNKCPSGALKYESTLAAKNEAIDSSTEIKIINNGPLYFKGNISIVNFDGENIVNETRAALCRCGASKNKPFCDNSHLEVKFNG